MIEFNCPTCGAMIQVEDRFAGRTGRCKHCHNQITVPGPGQAEAVAAAAGQSAAGDVGLSRGGRGGGAARPSDDSRRVLRGQTPHMQYEITHRPDFAMVKVHLEQGQKVFAEPSAMASMSPAVSLKAGLKGGLGKTLGRALGGESVIINTLEATRGAGEVLFAAGTPGDVAYYELNGPNLLLQRGAFLLHSEGVELSGKWQGAKGFFSGEGLVLLKATGRGDIFFNSYGAILEVDVTDEYYVDTGYVVAFEDSLEYRVTVLPGLRAGGKLKSFFFGGEGFVCSFRGQGRVWIQTRHPQAFLSWVYPFRPTKKE